MNESHLTNMQLERQIHQIESRLNNPNNAFNTIFWLKPLRDEDRETLTRLKHEFGLRRHSSDCISQADLV